ncbi:hypothetical protein G9C85_02650 [Halorubellus sp. JP-L1]|uniref:hypothetical protein n=1 Tax=Halorubellus sp. JP-L1 TaxID=2715753 RepID=UPI00140BBE0B|nr:hypothetical protein [Halorubellus sp. JP-L1]NHN40538.1 hypothetical protein [Halorubellus sp. JP-L1]
MPRKTRTIDVGEKHDELDARLDELAEQTAAGDADQDTLQEATRIETHRDALAEVAREHGEDAMITIGALTAGEYGRAEDYIKASVDDDSDAADGVSRIVFVATGLQDAPFLESGQSHEETIAVVSDQSPALVQFLEAEINEVTTPDAGNSKSFAELLAEKQRQTTSTDE